MLSEIKPIDKKDIPILVNIINLSYRSEHANAWTTESHLFDEGGKRIDEKELQIMLNDLKNNIFKYEKDGHILGTVCLTERPDALYLGTLAVDPSSQGLGIGKKMLDAAQAFAKEKNKSKIILTVISTRKELIAWYERHGYQKTGVIIPFPTEKQTLSKPIDTLFFEEMSIAIHQAIG